MNKIREQIKAICNVAKPSDVNAMIEYIEQLEKENMRLKCENIGLKSTVNHLREDKEKRYYE